MNPSIPYIIGNKIRHKICGEVHPNSYAGYLLLVDEYRILDDDSEFKNKDWYIKLQFNENFLKKYLSIHGRIICVYCGEKDLIIYDRKISYNQRDLEKMATVDHFYPISKGGEVFSHSNMVPSCHICNNKKGSKIYPLSALKYLQYHPNQPKNWIKI